MIELRCSAEDAVVSVGQLIQLWLSSFLFQLMRRIFTQQSNDTSVFTAKHTGQEDVGEASDQNLKDLDLVRNGCSFTHYFLKTHSNYIFFFVKSLPVVI